MEMLKISSIDLTYVAAVFTYMADMSTHVLIAAKMGFLQTWVEFTYRCQPTELIIVI
jgi:hypothetical protein